MRKLIMILKLIIMMLKLMQRQMAKGISLGSRYGFSKFDCNNCSKKIEVPECNACHKMVNYFHIFSMYGFFDEDLRSIVLIGSLLRVWRGICRRSFILIKAENSLSSKIKWRSIQAISIRLKLLC